ncbi:MAG: zinc ribbon domain-containing protein [Deltaproteobacteria bacterium]|nr:zinc ribbon domain-containing protein [Deltaproteobacteria bacterium]
MPIYEYECQKCRQVTEAMQKFSDAPLTCCPACSGELKKMISHSSFHLKGSGWYVTDYARKDGSAAPAAKKESTTESKPAASESSTASTPAATTKTDAA